MLTRVCYDNGHEFGEFEYFSNFNRINAKGIKEEIKTEMFKKYGSQSKYIDIINIIRV